ncbi:hypothetical protein PTSG_09563 [Salpingoeca rosetta]|uniref:Condensation domain-containing protein n=1 Tax=Salpingoeca rosetta (strain ATCC 50818 / BSB-021) TaxID=946362 RepID=F2ULC8_SALR5|nr:uncharacterized protein PTSG_09563 [Salpingoeca rosetta]EGD77927.1 hypothetical protein PTSG_09563 [Salpingoeca rosetta]|eukprot:XP_004989991.1 hypothetical protein PTSG_09563 [Salpingoeca rosetta]
MSEAAEETATASSSQEVQEEKVPLDEEEGDAERHSDDNDDGSGADSDGADRTLKHQQQQQQQQGQGHSSNSQPSPSSSPSLPPPPPPQQHQHQEQQQQQQQPRHQYEEHRQAVSQGESVFLHLPRNGAANLVASGVVRVDPDRIPLDQRITEDHIAAAVYRVQQRHCRLRAHVLAKDADLDEPFLVHTWPSPYIPPQALVMQTAPTSEAADAALQDVEADFLHMSFDFHASHRALFAVALVRSEEDGTYRIAVAAPHIVADLRGVVQVLKELVFHLGAVASAIAAPTDTAADDSMRSDQLSSVRKEDDDLARTTLPLDAELARLPPPRLVDLLPAEKKGWLNFLFGGGLGAMRDLLAHDKDNKALQWAEDAVAPPPSQTSRCVVAGCQLEKDVVSALRAAARAHGTTVTGAITMAALMAHREHVVHSADALARASKVMQANGTVRVPVTTTIDARAHTPHTGRSLPLDMVGNLSVAVATTHPMVLAAGRPLVCADFWTGARVFMDGVHAALQDKAYASAAWIFERMPAFTVAKAVEAAVTSAPCPITTGNVGRVEALPSLGCSLDTLSATFHQFVRGVYVAVTTYKGAMTITLSATGLKSEDMRTAAAHMASTLRAVAHHHHQQQQQS